MKTKAILLLLLCSAPIFSLTGNHFDFCMLSLYDKETSSPYAYKTLVSFGPSITFKIPDTRFRYGIDGLLNFSIGKDNVGKPDLDYPCPHDDFIIIGSTEVGVGLSIIPEFGYELLTTKNSSLTLLGGGGLTFGFLGGDVVSKSNATGWTYNEGDSGKSKNFFFFDYAGRIMYSYKKAAYSVGYSNARGIIISFGFKG